MKPLTHGSISTGIGGFDLGAKENGIKTVWTCEIDPLRRDILQYKYPNAKHYTDVRKLRKPPYVDIISFGFPCQDISNANHKAKGIRGQKSRLWYEGWRVICAVRPPFIVIENSPILVSKGLVTILGALAKSGYDAEWKIISCKRFGLPHIRKRLFVVAYSSEVRLHYSEDVRKNNFESAQKENSKESWLYTGRGALQHMGSTVIPKFQRMDDGLPRNIFLGLLAAAGDTVSPRITSWIFSRIKEATQKA